MLADAEMPAEYLEIELTESVAFGNPAIFPALEALRQIGVRIATDDFGTGYSCLQHLKCCPITTLKIDQSFVGGLADDQQNLRLRSKASFQGSRPEPRRPAKIRPLMLPALRARTP